LLLETVLLRPGQGGGSAGDCYVEEADDDANKVSRRPEAHPAGERIILDLTLPVITACKVVTYKRMYIRLKKSFRTHRHDRRLDYSCRLMRKNNHEGYLSIGHNFIVGIIEALRLGKF
jgi:hypothetical protein